MMKPVPWRWPHLQSSPKATMLLVAAAGSQRLAVGVSHVAKCGVNLPQNGFENQNG